MRRCLPLLLLATGCSLDLERLYAAQTGDAATDAPSLDAQAAADAALDATPLDATPYDATALDATPDADLVLRDAPLVPRLAVRHREPLGATPTSLAAAIGAGQGRVAVSMVTGETRVLSIRGSDCGLNLGDARTYGPDRPGPVAAGQLDGDGIPDFVTATASSLLTIPSTAPSMPVSSPDHGLGGLAALDVGFFDGPVPDVLAVGADGRRATLLTGTTGGSFSGTLSPTTSERLWDGALFQILGSSQPDVVLLSGAAGGPMNVLIFQGAGGVSIATVPTTHSVGTTARRLTTGRDAGGAPVIVAVGGRSVHFVSASGRLSADLEIGDEAVDVVIAEMDGASPPEIVMTDRSANALLIYRWEAPNLTRVEQVPLDGTPSELAAVDADADGVSDLLVLVGQELRLMSVAACP